MPLSTVSAALELVSKASKALDSIREQSKTSKDAALKANISKLYDDFLDLKAAVIRLTEENATLRSAQESEPPAKPQIKQIGETNFYYLPDAGPFCQPCYDGSGKLVHVSPRQSFVGGIGRKCEVCNKVFFEYRKAFQPPRGTEDRGPWG